MGSSHSKTYKRLFDGLIYGNIVYCVELLINFSHTGRDIISRYNEFNQGGVLIKYVEEFTGGICIIHSLVSSYNTS